MRKRKPSGTAISGAATNKSPCGIGTSAEIIQNLKHDLANALEMGNIILTEARNVFLRLDKCQAELVAAQEELKAWKLMTGALLNGAGQCK